jgi:hypothetical protein
MQLLRLLISYLWPERREGASLAGRSNANLKPIIAIAIVMLCGPEVFAAANMLLLLDLLGTGLFVLAFMSGFKVLGLMALEQLRRVLFPPSWSILLTHREQPRLVMHGALLLGRNAIRVSLLIAVSLTGIVGVLGGAI